MANWTRATDEVELEEIRRQVEQEIRRLSRYRLKSSARSSTAALGRLERAGVLTKRFAGLLREIILAATTPNSRTSRRLAHDGPDALALLRIVPNTRS